MVVNIMRQPAERPAIALTYRILNPSGLHGFYMLPTYSAPGADLSSNCVGVGPVADTRQKKIARAFGMSAAHQAAANRDGIGWRC
jgi:hypothetical protein